jgi:hypothetical protein
MVLKYFQQSRIQTPDCDYVPCLLTDGRVGYEVLWKDGSNRRSYIYMNPSGDYDGTPDVFVYTGPTPDIQDGFAEVFIVPQRGA